MLSPIGRGRRAKDHVSPFSRETVALLSGLERAACVSGEQRCGSLICGTFWIFCRSLTVFQHGCCHNDRGECRRDGEGRVGWEMPEVVPGFLGGVSQSGSNRLHCVAVGPRTRCTRTDTLRMFFNVNSIFDDRMLCRSLLYALIISPCTCAGSRPGMGRWSMSGRPRSWSGPRGTPCWWASPTWRASTRSWPPPSRRSTTGELTREATDDQHRVTFRSLTGEAATLIYSGRGSTRISHKQK